MAKKHIIKFGYRSYACDSITAANQAIAILSKLVPVEYDHDDEGPFYKPDTSTYRSSEISLELNKEFRDPEKPKKAAKPLALPKPARGTIRCICNKSDVSPKRSCPHCGRPFTESHSRTHDDKREHGEHPRLL